ncbi:hypothetical protein H8K52_20270 [Undibacterium seohonense]|uniref:Uncharacterized protein n=1 Tax=Undibacterium seohonense TaxID=1344950 RepID=A0ABR6X9Q9_9BURK|nr:hypothetical protein [Undibacterium seohonense]MBC3809675.1 hypothetical protein [Undibacterium seohonense]
MSTDQVGSLKTLHLYGMATAWSELQAEKRRPRQICPQNDGKVACTSIL